MFCKVNNLACPGTYATPRLCLVTWKMVDLKLENKNKNMTIIWEVEDDFIHENKRLLMGLFEKNEKCSDMWHKQHFSPSSDQTKKFGNSKFPISFPSQNPYYL